LGWLQFQRLCELVLELEGGVDQLVWGGRAEEWRAAFTDGPVALRSLGAGLPGPGVIAIMWVRDDPRGSDRGSRLATRMLRLSQELAVRQGGRVLLLTNLLADELRDAPAEELVVGDAWVVVGAEELGCCLDARAELRVALPSVLGLRDLEPLIDREVGAGSSLDVRAAWALARVFVPTRTYDRARGVLARHRFVVLTGPPEMGKTAIARMIALAAMTAGWEAHECTSPDEVWAAFAKERRQVFVADDAFGSTEYRPDTAERWARELGRILGGLDDEHWLIWTSRPAPLRAGLRRIHRERGAEHFPSPGEVLVDASDLDLAEKTLILYRHAKGHGDRHGIVRASGLRIVQHPHFTPERIRRFVDTRLDELHADSGRERLRAVIERELATPTEAMANSFAALSGEHRAVLVALLDTPAGGVDERELAATVRRHHPGGLSRPPADLVDRLTDHFLRLTPSGIGWVHPSWRDLVIEQLRADPPLRRRFLEACALPGVMLALSPAGGAAGERCLPLLIEDHDWDLLAERLRRLVGELEDRDTASLLLAISAAQGAADAPRQAAEVQGVADQVLSLTSRVWNRRDRVLPLFLLEAWFALRAGARERPDPPQLAPTWAELHPGALANGDARREFERAEEWLTLAELLARHAPATLSQLGFPDRDGATFERLIRTASTIPAADSELQLLLDRTLTRIADLAPNYGHWANSTIMRILPPDRAPGRWWVPTDLPEPPSTERISPHPVLFTRDDVQRVLDDL
jgi:hypothetical protein